MVEVFYGTKQKHAVENCGPFLCFIRGCKPFDGSPLFFEQDGGLKQAAQMQSVYTLDITTTRGRIYDRNLNPLTDTEKHNLIAVLPTDEAAQACAGQIEGEQRRQALDALTQGNPFVLDLEDGDKVYAQDIENFTTTARLPHDQQKQLAVHLLGYLNGDGEGVSGIEQAYDEELSAAGEEVRVRCTVNALGEAVDGSPIEVQGISTSSRRRVWCSLWTRGCRVSLKRWGKKRLTKVQSW